MYGCGESSEATYEDVMGSTYGVVGSQETTQEVWVPESRSSRTETRAGVPMVRFIGQELNSVWSWKNQNKELMELSSAGLSLPKPYETDGRNRAVLTSTEFEQSFTADDESHRCLRELWCQAGEGRH